MQGIGRQTVAFNNDITACETARAGGSHTAILPRVTVRRLTGSNFSLISLESFWLSWSVRDGTNIERWRGKEASFKKLLSLQNKNRTSWKLISPLLSPVLKLNLLSEVEHSGPMFTCQLWDQVARQKYVWKHESWNVNRDAKNREKPTPACREGEKLNRPSYLHQT